jgi:hypothetical protein
MDVKHRPAARTIKLVAYRIAWYASRDGGNVFPAQITVGTSCQIDISTVKTVLRILRMMGLLKLVRRGGGNHTAIYQLSTPSDLLRIVEYLAPDGRQYGIESLAPEDTESPAATEESPAPEDTESPAATEESPAPEDTESPAATEESPAAEDMPPTTGDIQVGYPPQAPAAPAEDRGGMPTAPPEIGVGCPPKIGVGCPPPTYQRPTPQTSPAKTSPQVSTSPGATTTANDQDELAELTRAHIAILRASIAGRRRWATAPPASPALPVAS